MTVKTQLKHMLKMVFLASLIGLASVSRAGMMAAKAQSPVQDWAWHGGVASTIVSDIYDQSKAHTIVYPYVSFDYKRLTVLGPSGWLRVLGPKNMNISVGGTLLPDSFNPKKSTNTAIQKLNNRKYSIGLGLQASYLSTKFGLINARLLKAFYGGDGGYYSSLSYMAMLSKKFTKIKVSLIPELGLQHYSGKLADYYYGVSADEQVKSGIKAYTPGAGLQPYISLGVLGVINNRFDLYASVKGARLPDAVFNSPIISKRYVYTTSLILSMGL